VADEDADRLKKLREDLRRRLAGMGSALPTSAVRRLGGTAVTALRTRRLLKPRKDEEILGIDEAVRLVASLGQLKGLSMKLGQVMSYIDVALPEDLRHALSVLQSQAPPMPFDDVEATLREDLGDQAGAILATIGRTPIASASIGQVHRARLPDRTPVAVKVQYPEIERAIRNDFRVARIGPAFAAAIYPGAPVAGFINEAKTRLLEECDYVHEADVQARFAAIYADHPVLVVPAVHREYSSRHVLVTTFLEGATFQDWLDGDPPKEQRDRVGRALFEFYVGSIFRHRLYNCDPHPGNYVIMPDGRLGILDYGCVREFSRDFVAALARLTGAMQEDDTEALRQELAGLGIIDANDEEELATAHELLRSFYGPMLEDAEVRIEPGASLEFRDILRSKRRLMRLHLPPEFFFLFRIRFGLLSVIARTGARANWNRLEREYAEAADA
jgi:predicted unusual protein kinase regulating ubiquinone biosynthesis (AarF/ABC1/UbiB family)